jgi:fructose/tagatose bisphosphate aldolase
LPQKIEKHKSSAKHIRNVIDLAMLVKVNIATQLRDAYRSSINKNNKEVRRNRDILSKTIDCMKFCGKFELPLCGHDENSDFANPGVF